MKYSKLRSYFISSEKLSNQSNDLIVVNVSENEKLLVDKAPTKSFCKQEIAFFSSKEKW